jgi:hypothetical protein
MTKNQKGETKMETTEAYDLIGFTLRQLIELNRACADCGGVENMGRPNPTLVVDPDWNKENDPPCTPLQMAAYRLGSDLDLADENSGDAYDRRYHAEPRDNFNYAKRLRTIARKLGLTDWDLA